MVIKGDTRSLDNGSYEEPPIPPSLRILPTLGSTHSTYYWGLGCLEPSPHSLLATSVEGPVNMCKLVIKLRETVRREPSPWSFYLAAVIILLRTERYRLGTLQNRFHAAWIFLTPRPVIVAEYEYRRILYPL